MYSCYQYFLLDLRLFIRYVIEDIDDEKKDAKGVDNKKVRLQECGPRFCLKLRTLQHGTFDSKFGEFEFVYKVMSF